MHPHAPAPRTPMRTSAHLELQQHLAGGHHAQGLALERIHGCEKGFQGAGQSWEGEAAQTIIFKCGSKRGGHEEEDLMSQQSNDVAAIVDLSQQCTSSIRV